MRLKRVQIVVQGEEEFYHQVQEAFSRVASAAQKGKELSRAIPMLSFPSIAEMARTLTPKRLELLRLIALICMSICDLSFPLEEKLGLPNSSARKFNNGAEEYRHEQDPISR